MKKLFEEFNPKTLKDWNDRVIADLKGASFESLIWNQSENIKIAPIYHRESNPDKERGLIFEHSDWEIEQTLNTPNNKKVLACLNSGATALLLKNISSEHLDTVLENVWFQHIQTSFITDSPNRLLSNFISLIKKRDQLSRDYRENQFYITVHTIKPFISNFPFTKYSKFNNI